MSGTFQTPFGLIPAFGMDEPWFLASEQIRLHAKHFPWWVPGTEVLEIYAGEGIFTFAEFPDGKTRPLAICGNLPPGILDLVRQGIHPV